MPTLYAGGFLRRCYAAEMLPILETERLVLRPLQLEDAPRIQELFAHWEIVRLLNAIVPWPFPADGALMHIRDTALPLIERGESWDWTLRLKTEPETIIGRIGLYLGEDNRGFWMGMPWQGQGLMTEAVIAVTDFWFDVLGFPMLRVPKAVENVGSRRISEKTGMRVVEVKESEYVSGRLQTEVWQVTAEEWRTWRRR
jgi:[ribosomal protein S5]-alanine N-acetyltransferase